MTYPASTKYKVSKKVNDKDTPVHKALGMLADIIEGN